MRATRCVLHVAPVLPEDVRNQLLALEEFQLLRAAVGFFSYAHGGVVERLLSMFDRALGCELIKKTSSRRIDLVIARRMECHLWSEFVRQFKSKLCRYGFEPKATDTCGTAIDRWAASLVGPGVGRM
jgi:hypothetical protein